MGLWLACFLLSALLVDLAGYWLHRWAHRPGSPLYRPHMTHHVVNYPPRRFFSDRYRSSRADSLLVWFAPFGLVYVALAVCLGLPHLSAILLGGAAVAIASSVIHDLTHISGSIVWRWSPFLGMAVRHHGHHFKMGRNFGIVSGLWDRLFGTRTTTGRSSRSTPRDRLPVSPE